MLFVLQIYPEKELLAGKLEVLSKTTMVDFQMDTYRRLNGLGEDDTDDELKKMGERKVKVVEELEQLSTDAAPILRIVNNESLVQALRKDGMYTVGHLVEDYEVCCGDDDDDDDDE